jgi:RNA polymerase sigma-70 factor (ECF subfamily)
VTGAERVAKLILRLLRFAGDAGRFEPAVYNNAPALKLYLGDSFEGILMVEIADGRISRLYAMRNPDKLATVLVPRRISR